ncbi:unnamed protein product [Acanthoscelides obtectus]|uniref:Uncharacterized protein n=1 Tax=Acanthoscelides obtectus TaxID=200917 RepID=A0A9P0LF32_ACAOB|nr:unnamed protein product [Acanthoscelides obtectus]CAK1655758.1 hypothetical protein AOBTE_LOCUS19308 [Acanthoscelides obtectus]
MHSKCFETAAKLFVIERKSWKCRSCTTKLKPPLAFPVSDLAVVQLEVDHLKREIDLLSNLNGELKSNNDLLKEKIHP